MYLKINPNWNNIGPYSSSAVYPHINLTNSNYAFGCYLYGASSLVQLFKNIFTTILHFNSMLFTKNIPIICINPNKLVLVPEMDIN